MLMSSGALIPCQSLRLYSGTAGPSTEAAAMWRKGPTVAAGKMPTTRHVTTSTSTGRRIQCTGSCGSRGRSVAGGPKKTWWMKRSE